MIYLRLFLTFLQIGAVSFGGGYAMISLIREKVLMYDWITESELLNMIAIAESTPGPIAINTATFVGYRVAGVLGSAMATFGVVLPSFLIITLISYVLNEFQSLKAVQYAFFGIRAGVLALILKAWWSMYKQCPKKILSYCIAAGALIAAAFLDINVLFVIIGCAVTGLIASLLHGKRGAAK